MRVRDCLSRTPHAQGSRGRTRSTITLHDHNGGLITRQEDSFDFHVWAGQALGLKGRLLGWTPIVKGAAQKQAAAGLSAFLAKQV